MSLLAASIYLAIALASSAPTAQFWKSGEERSAELVRIITNAQSGSDERNVALSSLAASDFNKAMEIAPSLLAEGNRELRARAAWVLADGGQQSGIDVLKAMTRERTAESVIAIEALGRLRDPGSHELLVSLLEQELASPRRGGSLFGAPGSDSWTAALSGALADYGDKRDTALLVRTLPDRVGPGSYVRVEDVGRTGGKEAIPVLERIFDTSAGWTVMAAGLALARCGSPRGTKYVRERLADTSGDPEKPNESRMTNAETDNPHGPKGTDFILTNLGVSADEIFVPELVQIVSAPERSWAHKAQAWQALSRMNPVTKRQEILELAWKNLIQAGAIKLIVLNDEARARRVAPGLPNSTDRTERAAAYELKRALFTSPRERRRWREIHGYTF
jgi:HEAT repeat protein